MSFLELHRCFLMPTKTHLIHHITVTPDPLQSDLKGVIGKLKDIAPRNIFLGNGSDEAIDLLFRAFCEPGQDNVVAIDPSYGMYEVCANINNIAFKKVLLNDDYSLNADALLEAADENTKLIFLCSPNNPTGNALEDEAIIKVIENFDGLVVVDEAYIDFAPEKRLPSSLVRLR